MNRDWDVFDSFGPPTKADNRHFKREARQTDDMLEAIYRQGLEDGQAPGTGRRRPKVKRKGQLAPILAAWLAAVIFVTLLAVVLGN